MTARAALVPGVLALLPTYAGGLDPVAELRAACTDAVAALVQGGPGRVVLVCARVRADEADRGVRVSAGARVGRHLLEQAGHTGEVVDDAAAGGLRPDDAALLVANGSACRSEKAPGHLDERSFRFDAQLARTLHDGSAPPHDDALAEALWCFDLDVFRRLSGLVDGAARVTYDDDPYGVAYWVATWPGLQEGRGR